MEAAQIVGYVQLAIIVRIAGIEAVTLAEELFRALSLTPCFCAMKWVKDGAEREVVKQCPRCRAVERYEKEKAECDTNNS